MRHPVSSRNEVIKQGDPCSGPGIQCRRLFWVLLALTLVLCGCASGTTRKTASMKSAKNVKSSPAEISSRNQSLLGLYSAEIEAAADKIIFESPSAVARRQALEWKAEAIPVLQRSLLNTDPIAAALDTWAFIFQMTAYMEQPGVKQGFGEFYPAVAETLKKMDTDMEQQIRTAAPSANVADLHQKVESWAEAHPIRTGLAGRETADPELISRTEQSDLGAVASIKALGEGLGDITARLDSYNAYLPKQARWQAELALMDLMRDPRISGAVSNVGVLSDALAKTSGSMEHLPELMGQAREAMVADVESQRLGIQAFMRQERLETMDTLKRERIATVAAMDSERRAATADLQRERQIVLDALRGERVAAMSDLNGAGDKALKDLNTQARGLIDLMFLRAVELVLLTLVLCALAAWILLRWFARRPDRGERIFDRAA
jgi:hypothetical protein